MSYFEDGDTVPPPFNMIPTSKSFHKLLKCGNTGRSTKSFIVNNFYVSPKLVKILSHTLSLSLLPL